MIKPTVPPSSGGFSWLRANWRALQTFVLLMASASALGVASTAMPKLFGGSIADILGILGISCLSIPAIKLNEEARQIYRVQTLIERARMTGEDEEQRVELLTKIEQEVSGQKGSWSPLVQGALYTGYVFLFASAVARLT